MFAPELLDHFQNPRNAGEVAAPDASAQRENPACGDVLRFTLRCEHDCIVEIRFLAQGCVAAVACASAVTELVQGKSIGEARKLQREDIVRAVGGLPPESHHASYLVLETLCAMLDGLAKS